MVGLTSLITRNPPMPPKLNRRRALFVLGKIDEILAWEQTERERSATPSLSNSGVIFARFGRDSIGGWRT